MAIFDTEMMQDEQSVAGHACRPVRRIAAPPHLPWHRPSRIGATIQPFSWQGAAQTAAVFFSSGPAFTVRRSYGLASKARLPMASSAMMMRQADALPSGDNVPDKHATHVQQTTVFRLKRGFDRRGFQKSSVSLFFFSNNLSRRSLPRIGMVVSQPCGRWRARHFATPPETPPPKKKNDETQVKCAFVLSCTTSRRRPQKNCHIPFVGL